MLKLQEEKPQESQLVRDILVKISRKMMALGFSRQEILQSVLKVVNRVLKVRAADFREMTKVLWSRLSQKQNKSIISDLVVELDLLLTSTYDNYDSDPEDKNLKIENAPQKASEQEKSLESVGVVEVKRGRQERERPHRSFGSFLARAKERRFLEKQLQRVKLQFLNGQQF